MGRKKRRAREDIEDLLSTHGPMRVKDIVNATGWMQTTVSRALGDNRSIFEKKDKLWLVKEPSIHELFSDTPQLKAPTKSSTEDSTTAFDPFTDIEEHRSEFEHLTTTERQAVVKSRIGQGLFRDRLIKLWGGCAITGITKLSVLRASHAKPWRDSTNKERLDPHNGLLLIPNLDHLFDRHLIGFEQEGNICISPALSEEEQRTLGVTKSLWLREIIPETQEYLRYHLSHLK